MNSERAAFEAWFMKSAKAPIDPWHKEFAWQAWQAASATKVDGWQHNYWQDVFKNANCLENWANRDSFWEKQPYGTRFYFGDGAFDYIQRGILESAVKHLNQSRHPAPPTNNDN